MLGGGATAAFYARRGLGAQPARRGSPVISGVFEREYGGFSVFLGGRPRIPDASCC